MWLGTEIETSLSSSRPDFASRPRLWIMSRNRDETEISWNDIFETRRRFGFWDKKCSLMIVDNINLMIWFETFHFRSLVTISLSFWYILFNTLFYSLKTYQSYFCQSIFCCLVISNFLNYTCWNNYSSEFKTA